jgi:protein-tyrosine phosphatase
MGYLDLHVHLLWGLDDGARDEDESLELCAALAGAGFTAAAPSPHALPELPGEAEAEERRVQLVALLGERGLGLELHRGAENRLDGELLERAGRGAARPVGAGPWVLAEAPFSLPLPGAEQLCFRLQVAGLRPLLAHPERCRAFQDDPALARRLVEAGSALQLNLGSLVGVYGRDVRRRAERLLAEGLYAVAASDLHRPEAADRTLGEGLEALRRQAGDAAVQLLLDQNPHRLLRGEVLP